MLTPHEHAQLHALYPEKYGTLRSFAAAIGLGKSGLARILGTPANTLRVHPRTAHKIRKFLAHEAFVA